MLQLEPISSFGEILNPCIYYIWMSNSITDSYAYITNEVNIK